MAEIIAAALCGLAVGFVVGRRNRADPVPVPVDALALDALAPADDPDDDSDIWVPGRRRAGERPAKRTCSPHQWKVPAPADDGLVCTECGRYIEWAEIRPYMLGSIMKAVR